MIADISLGGNKNWKGILCVHAVYEVIEYITAQHWTLSNDL